MSSGILRLLPSPSIDALSVLGVVLCGTVVVADAWWDGAQVLRSQAPCLNHSHALSNALVIDGELLARQGYLVIDNVLSPAQVACAARGVTHFVQSNLSSRFGQVCVCLCMGVYGCICIYACIYA